MKGMRQQKQPSSKDQIKRLSKEVENLNMVVRIMQMSLQQLLNSFKTIDQDVGRSMSVLNDIQYRTLAMLDLTKEYTKEDLDIKADELKLKDYNEASDKEDLEKGYTKADTVEESSIVIVTSKTVDETNKDKAIFRSKFPLAEAQDPQFKKDMLGKKVGDKIRTTINGIEHDVELLSIRAVPQEEKKEDAVGPLAQNAEQTAGVQA